MHIDDDDVALLGVKRLELDVAIAIEPSEGLSFIFAAIPGVEFILDCFYFFW